MGISSEEPHQRIYKDEKKSYEKMLNNKCHQGFYKLNQQ